MFVAQLQRILKITSKSLTIFNIFCQVSHKITISKKLPLTRYYNDNFYQTKCEKNTTIKIFLQKNEK
ncbi:hypothetical protein HpHA233_10940 [Helicobacter pylori]